MKEVVYQNKQTAMEETKYVCHLKNINSKKISESRT